MADGPSIAISARHDQPIPVRRGEVPGYISDREGRGAFFGFEINVLRTFLGFKNF